MRGIIPGLIVLLLVTALPGQTRNKSVRDLFEEPSSSPEASTPTGDSSSRVARVLAEVNDRTVLESEFRKILWASAGNRVLRQLIGLELAKQMAAAEGVAPSPADFDRELLTVQSRLGPEKDSLGRPLTSEDRRRILGVLLERRGISFEEFEVGIHQQAYLRAIARKKIAVTDAQVREEFGREYGKKRTVRAIILQDLKIAEDVYRRLKQGDNFATLAARYSIDFDSAPAGGSIGDLAPGDPKTPPLVSKTAFALAPGTFSSPLKVDREFWIIKIEREIPPQPISLDSVRSRLVDRIRTRLENQRMEAIQAELLKNAKIKIYDKPLAKDFNRWLKDLQRNEP